MEVHHIAGFDVLIAAIVVFFIGDWTTRRISFLSRNSIPVPVTGGLICSILVALIALTTRIQIEFDMQIRDILLLVFFSTIGLSAKVSTLKAGGKALGLLVLLAAVFLIVQDTTGVGLMMLVNEHPGYGLLGGSISFAGGHGTAIAWGQVAEEAGLTGAAEFGIACATFGLIVGGLIGGPIAGYLIRRNRLEHASSDRILAEESEDEPHPQPSSISDILTTLLVLAVCVELGNLVNRFLFHNEIMLPGFLTCMSTGIVITNTTDLFKVRLHAFAIDRFGELSLQLFLSISLMSMQLLTLLESASVLLLVLLAQVTAMTLFAVFIVFRVMGRDYDAAVIVGGFTGLGLGATPVAIANMHAITRKFGPSTKAFIVIPLVGAFFIDLLNALVIKYFLTLPLFAE